MDSKKQMAPLAPQPANPSPSRPEADGPEERHWEPGDLRDFLAHDLSPVSGTLDRDPVLKAVAPALGRSSVLFGSAVSMAIPDNVTARIQESLLPNNASEALLVPARCLYRDMQFVPQEMASEGDAVDLMASNVLLKMLKPLNDILRYSHKLSKGLGEPWTVQLRAQVNSPGAQGDHVYVLVPPQVAYKPVRKFTTTTAEAGPTGMAKLDTQYALLVVEEKRRGHVPKLLKRAKTSWTESATMVDLGTVQGRRSFVRNTYAQLFKYSEAYKCTRLLLTDYTFAYGIQLEHVVSPKTEEQLKASARQRQDGVPNPEFLFYHWLSLNIRRDILFLCVAGFYELGILNNHPGVSKDWRTPEALLVSLSTRILPRLHALGADSEEILLQNVWHQHREAVSLTYPAVSDEVTEKLAIVTSLLRRQTTRQNDSSTSPSPNQSPPGSGSDSDSSTETGQTSLKVPRRRQPRLRVQESQ